MERVRQTGWEWMRASQIYFWCPLNAIYRISKDTPIDVQMYSVSKHPVLYHGKGTAIHWCGSCGFYFDSERAGGSIVLGSGKDHGLDAGSLSSPVGREYLWRRQSFIEKLSLAGLLFVRGLLLAGLACRERAEFMTTALHVRPTAADKETLDWLGFAPFTPTALSLYGDLCPPSRFIER